ncbi:hypothetical protein BG011_003272 [Mortierella polycephala]|uniref:Uncharacterized protein n=1 Tax=Mortierella polycephala TaxID=41804 RepID=A0A9P6Q2L4_9FUNG|nr:hypothetical protein BG011_003272 [Mortierella polycephala]
MLHVHRLGLVVLVALAGSNHYFQGPKAFVQAYQDPGRYVLAPGLEILDTPTPNAVEASGNVARADPRPNHAIGLSPGPESLPSIDITTPLLNSVYAPGSSFIMTWSNNGIRFPSNWTPPQSIIDMIMHEVNISHSAPLKDDDIRVLAQKKLEDLRRMQLDNIIKDSLIWLHSVRLVNWPLQIPDAKAPTNGTMKATLTHQQQQQQSALLISLSPSILVSPGYNLVNVSRMTILGSAGGQLTWSIPEDWAYEGEFEIRIPSVHSGTGSDGAKSRTFWILRDAATRARSPAYNLPSMDLQQQAISSSSGQDQRWYDRTLQRQKDTGVILGVAAMLLALLLVALGMTARTYRRKWAKNGNQSMSSLTTSGTTLAAGSETSIGSLSSYMTDSSIAAMSSSCYSLYTSSSSARSSRVQQPQLQYPAQHYNQSQVHIAHHAYHPLDFTSGDQDALSPIDMNISGETLGPERPMGAAGTAAATVNGGSVSEKVSSSNRGVDRNKSALVNNSNFVDLPLYNESELEKNADSKGGHQLDLNEKEQR